MTEIEVTDTTTTLRGYEFIADFTGLGLLEVKSLVAQGELPHFTREGKECAERSPLIEWARTRFWRSTRYAPLGDGRSAALVDSDGSIDRWCVANMDSAASLDTLLDPRRSGKCSLRLGERIAIHEVDTPLLRSMRTIVRLR